MKPSKFSVNLYRYLKLERVEQMKNASVIFMLSLFIFFLTLPASGSVIDANVVRGRISLSAGFAVLQGFGLVTTANFPIDNRMSLGGSLGYSLESPNPYLADLHMNLQFIEPSARNPLSMSVVGGIWGGTSAGLWISKKQKDFYVQPELGLTMSYLFDSYLTGRLNLVYGPSLGVEIGYKLSPWLEGIFAISEQVIGIKFRLL